MLNSLHLTIILAALFAMPAYADDTAATLAAGGLVPVKSTSVSMVSEDLQSRLQKTG